MSEWTAPPQVDEGRAIQLAYMHAQAFYYFVTYNRERRAGWQWRGPFMPIDVKLQSDCEVMTGGVVGANASLLPYLRAPRHDAS